MEPRQYEGHLSALVDDKVLGKAKIRVRASADHQATSSENGETYRELETAVLKRLNYNTTVGLIELFPGDFIRYMKLGHHPINVTLIRTHLPSGSALKTMCLRLRDVKNINILH